MRGPAARLRLGLAIGATCAIFVFFAGIAAALFGWGMLFVQVMSSMFIGYSPTLVGSIAGAVWALADGLVAGVLIGSLYNLFLRTRR